MTSSKTEHALSRRQLLSRASCGFGSLAFAALCAEQPARAAANPLAPKPTHFPPRAKRVIFLWMQGGPSHVDLFEYKPRLQKHSGEPLPFELPKTRILTDSVKNTQLMGPISNLVQRGQSGLYVSDWLPHLAQKADEICLLSGMNTDSEAHAPAVRMLHTGASVFVRPSMGAWATYGLGTENQNLPGFVTIRPDLFGDGGNQQLYGGAFLPAAYQGTSLGEALRGPLAAIPPNPDIRYLQDHSIAPAVQRRQIDFLQTMNRRQLEKLDGDREVEGLIQSFELAFRMQAEAPAVLDLSKESKATQDLYGIGDKETNEFGQQCLLARRLVEAGVRFVQITSVDWDHHGGIKKGLLTKCKYVDKPIAGLLTDLKARGLLDDTLILWSGEFGRTPYRELNPKVKQVEGAEGREHNPYGFTCFLAGAGVKRGMQYGSTDEFGYRAVEGKADIHDLHATMLHILGIDHERLTYRFGGRDFRLTDVYGTVIKAILS
jgi:hypothetical protein